VADNSLEVKITADVTSLQAKSAVAKAELAELNSSVKSLAGQFVGASDEMKASLAPQLDAAAKKAAAARDRLMEFNAQLRERPETGGMFAKLTEGLEGAAGKVESLTAKMQGFSKLTAAVSEFVLAGLAVEKVGEAFKQTAEMGDQLLRMSQKTGMAVETLSGVRVVAVQTDTDFEMVGQAMARLGNTMQEAVQSPTSKAAAAFRELDISVTDAAGNLRPMQDMLEQVAQKISEYQDGTAKAALVSDILGAKIGDNLIPFLNELGGQSLAGVTEQAQRMGVGMTQAQAEMDTQFSDALKNTGVRLEGMRNAMVQGAIPGVTLLAQQFEQLTEQGGVLRDAALAVGVGLDVIVVAADATGAIVVDLSATVEAFGKTLDAVVYSAEALGDAMTGNFKAAAAAGVQATNTLETAWTNAASKINQSWTDVGGAATGMAKSTWTEITGEPTKEPAKREENKPLAPTIDKAALEAGKTGGGGASSGRSQADEQIQIARDAADAQKQIQQSLYQSQVSQWEMEIAQGKMTKAQEIQNEITAQNRIYDARLAEMEKEAALDHLSATQKAKALDDIAVYQAQHNAEMARLDEQLVAQQVADAKKVQQEQENAAQASQQAWQKAFQPITQAFDSSINGVLQGTETLKQAELKAAQSITLAFIDAAAKKVIASAVSEARILATHLATETGMTAATTAGEAARLTVKTSASATGKAVNIADGTAQINADAMKAAAGAYSAVAGIPIIGPVLAPAAAATAYAGVMAFDVLSAERGMAIGPGVNPLVQLHEQEMVLPAHIAQPLMNMVSGDNLVTNNSSGGDTYHVSIAPSMTANGIGATGFADQVWKAINDGFRNGLHNKYPATARMMRR
jgi:PIN domain nuclease of toxin-antitoxin system